MTASMIFCAVTQEAQITLECAVPRKHHGSIMGPKGCRIQDISRTHNVTIKIPDRNTEGMHIVDNTLCSL